MQFLKAVVFDWAGTMIDFGCLAPAVVFQKVFEAQGIAISVPQARGPMGMAKREHLAAVANLPEVARQWQQVHSRTCTEHDIDAMYDQFLPLQKGILHEYSELIPGAAECAKACRDLGLAIGSSTGYTHELMEIVASAAAAQGYQPDVILCSGDTPRGRPAPYLLHEAAKRLDVYPMWHVIKVDDTTVGIEAGRNACCWNVGITRTGNLVGLSQQDLETLPLSEQEQLCARAAAQLRQAGAHYVCHSVAELPDIIPQIEARLAAGEMPWRT